MVFETLKFIFNSTYLPNYQYIQSIGLMPNSAGIHH